MKATDQWSILAGLRFVLASIVAFDHLQDYTSLGWLGFVPRFGAFEAILGFLLISGYSVSMSYKKEPAGYLVRRLKRIYPCYLTAIAFTFAVVFRDHVPSVGYLVANAVFLNQLVTTSSFIGPAWSLSLEFWLYCLAPLLMVTRPAWTRRLVYLSFGSYLIYTACRTLFHLPYYSAVGYGANLPLLSFIWICGLRLARRGEDAGMVMRDIRVIFFLHIAFASGIQFLSRARHHAVGMFYHQDTVTFAMQALTLCLVYAVFALFVAGPRVSGGRSRTLRFLGDVSYPLYLMHTPVYVLLANTRLNMGPWAPLAYYGIALAVSAAVYWSVDLYSKRRHLQLGTA